ncbi:MAG: hypothetical protein KDB03_08510 [Planctomycetales bacterium]|nr:hypothetical protein [Planctomycetales bacterium]
MAKLLEIHIFMPATRFLLVMVIVHLAAVTARGDLIFVSGTRTVSTSTIFSNNNSSTAPGDYDQTVSSQGNFGIGTATENASHQSSVPVSGPQFDGNGLISSIVVLNSGGSTIGGSSGASLDIVFNVDQSGSYQLDATATWTGTVLSNGGTAFNFSFVELSDSSGNLFRASRDVSQQGSDIQSGTVDLFSGQNYRIRAFTRIGGGFSNPGTFTANGSWNFSISQSNSVPEPSFNWAGILFIASLVRSRKNKPKSN